MADGKQPRYACPALCERGGAGLSDRKTRQRRATARTTAGHADREQAIDTLKTAFVHGQLTKDELDARAGRALAARTYADLAAVTAGIPPARPQPGRCAHRPRSAAGRWPGRPAGSGVCLIIAAAAAWVFFLLVADDGHYHGIPGANPSYESWAPLAFVLGFTAVCTAIGIFGSAVVASLEQRRSRRQLPPRPGGHAPEAGGAAAPAMARFPPAPAPARPRPTCGPTSHGSANELFPPRRAGHPVASRRQARSDAAKPPPDWRLPVVQAGSSTGRRMAAGTGRSRLGDRIGSQP